MTEALHRRSFDPTGTGPLSGIRVIDLSRLVCGNTLTGMLADFGADVIKVEPRTGDTLRAWKAAGQEAHWKVLCRNKRSVAIDFRHPDGVGVIRRLAASADVLVESFRTGTLEAMGIPPDALLAANPKLLIVRITGFGQTGPYARRPGFGTLVEGMSGFAEINGFPDREPVLPPLALADSVAGYAGAMATLAALRNVEVSGGKGQVIDVSLLDPMFAILGPQAASFRLTGRKKQRYGSRSPGTAPRNVYRTKDGRYVSLSTSVAAMAVRLFRAIGRDDLADDPDLRVNTRRVARSDELDKAVADFIAPMTQAEAVAFFEKAEVTIGPVYDIEQIMEDPHMVARETVLELDDPDLGSLPANGIPVRLTDTPGGYFRPAPQLGQHNAEALQEAGFSAAEIAELDRKGVLVTASETASEETAV